VAILEEGYTRQIKAAVSQEFEVQQNIVDAKTKDKDYSPQPRKQTILSEKYSAAIEKLVPGGVNSPFRSFEEVGGHTIFFSRAKGAYLYDVDGNKYIDYLGAWGPAILGHSPDKVVLACQQILEHGAVFGTPHTLELEFAEKLTRAIPSLQMVRLVNSGTEAVMSAVRLARGFTGKNVIVMVEGGYHGHSDSVLASTNGHRTSGGIPTGIAENTMLVTFNDLETLSDCLSANSGKIAAVLIEPVPGSMGVVPPEPGYLEGVRKLCDEHQCLLIFDEVLTGFRVAFGGAQALYNIAPDISCFGKGLGGGMPIGAFGGSRRIMEHLQPIGDVYQAGTFSGNPVTMAGGCAVLDLLAEPQVYETLEERSAQLFKGLQLEIDSKGYPVTLQRVGSMISILFVDKPVRNFADSKSIDSARFAKFFHHLLANGINLPPSSVDAAAVSAAHTKEDIDISIRHFQDAFKHAFVG
jgi:glutamate-1-semialdehyde 2,1-aminomutase